MGAGGLGEATEVSRVRCEDLIAITGQEDDPGVDDIGSARAGQQQADPAAEIVIDGLYVDAGEQAGKDYLASAPTAPDLADDSTVGQRRPIRLPFPFDDGDHVPIATLDGDERAGIEDDAHAAPRLVRLEALFFSTAGVRMTTARERDRRVAAWISSGVISPCSAS